MQNPSFRIVFKPCFYFLFCWRGWWKCCLLGQGLLRKRCRPGALRKSIKMQNPSFRFVFKFVVVFVLLARLRNCCLSGPGLLRKRCRPGAAILPLFGHCKKCSGAVSWQPKTKWQCPCIDERASAPTRAKDKPLLRVQPIRKKDRCKACCGHAAGLALRS